MITWSELRTLITRGTSVPVAATLRFHGSFDSSGLGWLMGGERIASLLLDPGEYRLVRDARRIRISDRDGMPRLVDDGDRVTVITDGVALDARKHLAVSSPATWLWEPRRLLRDLDQIFPSGSIEETECAGHRCFRIPGLPARYLGASSRTRWITVDAATGVLLAMDNGDGGGELLDVAFPESVDARAFAWDENADGVRLRPEPWDPPVGDPAVEDRVDTEIEPDPSLDPEPGRLRWVERAPAAAEVRTFEDAGSGERDLSKVVPGFPLAWEHPNGGWIVLDERADDERRVLVYRIGRLLEGTNGTDGSDGDDGVDAEIHWPEEATSWEARWVYVVDGSIFTSDDTTLTLRDADLQVVRRYWAPGDRFHLGVVGPWFGAFEYRPMRAEEDWWDEDDRPGTYRLFDPASTGPELDVVFEIPVKSSEVRVRWIDDELWLSDARLRVFRVVGAA